MLDSTNCNRCPSCTLPIIMKNEHLYDAWRSAHRSERDHTFYSIAVRVYSRIDLFLVDRDTLLQTKTTQIGLITWSEHAALYILSNLKPTSPKQDLEKNTSILHNPCYQEQINEEINCFFQSNIGSVDSFKSLWSAHKAYMSIHLSN